MSGRECSATKRGLRLLAGGMAYREAAAAVGVAPSTLVRAAARRRKAPDGKVSA